MLMPYRLLVIEDSPTQLLSIKRSLENAGYEVIASRSGAEGLVRAYNESPDVIISDVVMTGINGYQVCRLVKNDPELMHTPVLLLTKLDGSVDRFWGLKSGADRFIPKEPGFANLIQAVREILSDDTHRPRLRALTDPSRTPSQEDINNKLNQLLERLLFEANIAEEVRHLSDYVGQIDKLAQKLFMLLESFADFQAIALVLRTEPQCTIFSDVSRVISEESFLAYVARVATQLGLPVTATTNDTNGAIFESSLTQPIDTRSMRLGLLVIVPPLNHAYKPADQKVFRLVCEQLADMLKIYLTYVQHAEGVGAQP